MTRLFKYQKAGVKKLWRFLRFCRGALLADDMGLGKTIQVLKLLQWHVPDRRPVVVVCPATAKGTWEAQAAEHAGMRTVVLSGRTPPPDEVRRMRADRRVVYVVNYEVVRYWAPVLAKLRPIMLVADECQRCKSAAAKQTRAVGFLAEACKYKVFVGGTGGVEKTPIDVWPIFKMLLHPRWPRRWRRYAEERERFARRFCRVRRTRWGVVFEGGKNLDQLHRFMRGWFMVRRRTQDVLKDLPPKQRHVVPTPIKDQKRYAAAEQDAVRFFTRIAPSLPGGRRQVQERAEFGKLLRVVADLKMDAVKEWIDGFMSETGEKLLVFGWNKAVVQGLHKHYGDRLAVRVDGSVTGKKRAAAIDRFNHDPECRLLFGNLKAAGESWSCRSASTAACVQMFPNPAVHNQAEKRIHGVGRGVKGKVSRVFYLVAEGTREEALVKKLHREQKVIDGIIDGGTGGDGFDMNSMIRSVMTGL